MPAISTGMLGGGGGCTTPLAAGTPGIVDGGGGATAAAAFMAAGEAVLPRQPLGPIMSDRGPAGAGGQARHVLDCRSLYQAITVKPSKP